jgi:hypothetical protein
LAVVLAKDITLLVVLVALAAVVVDGRLVLDLEVQVFQDKATLAVWELQTTANAAAEVALELSAGT